MAICRESERGEEKMEFRSLLMSGSSSRCRSKKKVVVVMVMIEMMRG